MLLYYFFFFKQKTAYDLRISDWSSDVCSSDLSRLMLISTSSFFASGSAMKPTICLSMKLDSEIRLLRTSIGTAHFGSSSSAWKMVHRRQRSEESRVGKEWVSTCRSRWLQSN